MTKINGYLDRLRENLEVLDEAIANAREISKPKGKGDKAAALQWAKTLRDLVELRNTTLDRIKGHLLGRNETGTITEPENAWDENSQVMFERYFKEQLSPWTEQNLKLECEDCHVESEQVTDRYIDGAHRNLCDKCCKKRNESGLECESCGVRSKEVSKRRSPATWAAGIMLPSEVHNLCNECDQKRTRSLS